jgi:arylsulfatase A-like enzyme
MNVIVIISDSLRWDYLGFNEKRNIHTPHIDRFSERCKVFNRAYCASFPTMPMRSDFLTGRFTLCYRGWGPLPAEEIILPELLSDSGYRTMAVVDTPFYMRRGYGYDRGFDDFMMIKGQAPGDADTKSEWRNESDYCAPKTCTTAERWLERHYRDDFFLLVDAWDPHEPWDPPAYYVERYLPEWDGTVVWPPYWYCKGREDRIAREQLGTMQSLWTEWANRTAKKVDRPVHIVNRALGLAYSQGRPPDPVTVGETAEHLKIAEACYSGEVTMVDRAVGRLIERIDSLGLMEETAIFLTADHGFLFGEHNIFGKSIMYKGGHVKTPLYEQIARVPLLVHMPGAGAGETDALVSPPDLMPTILDITGVEIPDTVQGASFLPVILGEKTGHRDFVVSTMPLKNPGETSKAVDDSERTVEAFLPATITTDRWSLLYYCEGVPAELYDLHSDPDQTKNVAAENRPVVEELHGRFVSFLESCGTEERLLAPRRKL